MIVCVCHRVSDRDIARHVRGGMSFDDIQLELGVATQCGRCESCARDVVAQCHTSHPVAAVRRDSQDARAAAIGLASSPMESSAWQPSPALAAA